MVSPARGCAARTDRGEPCRTPPLQGGEHCFWHSPDTQQEAAEASRLGGLRRRREKTVAGAYDLGGLQSVAAVRRLLEIAVLDTLGLENSVARNRTLAYLAMAAFKALELGELEARLATLERAVQQPWAAGSVFALEAGEDRVERLYSAHFLRSVRGQHGQSSALQLARHVPQQLQRVGISPVQIVQEQHQRALASHRSQSGND